MTKLTDYTRYADAQAHADGKAPGLMEVDFLASGAARLAVIEWSPTNPQGAEVYSTSLTSAP